MESAGEDAACPGSSQPTSAAREEPAVPDVIITRRLRDREQLRKRQAEAQDNDLIQWFLREQRNKQQRRGRAHTQLLTPVKHAGRGQRNKQQRRGKRARRGRGHQQVVKLSQEPAPELDPQPKSQEPAPELDPQPNSQEPAPELDPQPNYQEPAPELDPQPNSQEEAEPGPSDLALPELDLQGELPVLTIQDLVNEIEAGVEEEELAARIQDPAGEEEMLQPAEAEIPGAWTTPLENDQQDN